jgi:hypothetical protein
VGEALDEGARDDRGMGSDAPHPPERREAGAEVLALDDEEGPLDHVLRPGPGGRQGGAQVAQERRAWRASKPATNRWPVGSALSPRDERRRSRAATWLRSIGFVVSPCARCRPVRTCLVSGNTAWMAVMDGW